MYLLIFDHIKLIYRFVVKTGVHYGLDYAVYRTLPTHCHSEICAMVVDATKPLYLSDDVDISDSANEDMSSGSTYTCNISGEEGGAEDRVEAEMDGFVPSKCQQGWRHISTLTRVMPVESPRDECISSQSPDLSQSPVSFIHLYIHIGHRSVITPVI